jgi:hypothetical protein
LVRTEERCFSYCPLRSVLIPRSVDILGKACFAGSQIGTIVFETESRMRRIEEACFAYCPLTEIHIPHSAEVVGDSCFSSELD